MIRKSIIHTGIASATFALLTAAGIVRSDTTPDLAGTWRLDSARSDSPQKMMSQHAGGSSWGKVKADHRTAGAGPGSRRAASRNASGSWMRLPALMTLDTVAGNTEVKDSTGAVVERILTTPGGSTVATEANGVRGVPAKWQGQDLQITVTGPSGRTMTQTWSLGEDGKSLKITTNIENPRQGDKSLQFTRVYQKVG